MRTIRHLPLTLPLCLAMVAPGRSSRAGDGAEPSTPPACVASSEPRDTQPGASPQDRSELAAGNTAFGLDLFQQIRAARPGNLFYSPFSISEALAMVWAGANGETERQMASVLHFTLPQERLHPAFDALELDLVGAGAGAGGAEGDRVDVANALWAQQGPSFQPSFLDTLARSYGACVHVVDFAREPARSIEVINQWVSDTTQGKIPAILGEGSVTPSTRFLLTNAIYFHEHWKYAFDPNLTQPGPFTRSDGSVIQVPMMTQTLEAGLAFGPYWVAIELPYRDGRRSMVAILPGEGTLDAFERSLTSERLATILSGLQPSTFELTLPKLEIDSSFQLEDPLSRMGMGSAFTDPGIPSDIDIGADFSRIDGARDLFITDVMHRAHVAVDEVGTEAAAATGGGVGLVLPAPPPPTVVFDHPFLFLIHDGGSILFFGRVADPSAR